MADRSFLAWPFFEERHRRFTRRSTPGARRTSPVDHRRRRCRLPRPRGAPRRRRLARAHCAVDPGGGRRSSTCARSASPRETLARHDGLADFAFAMQGLGAGAISLFGTARSSAHGCRRRARARRIAAFALTEPESGSDVANIAISRARDGDGYRPRRREDLDLERRHRRPLHRLRAHRRGAGREGPLGLHRRGRHARPGDRRAARGDRAASAGAAPLRELPRARRRVDRRARRGLQDRDGDARRLPLDRRRGGARLRPPRARRDARAGDEARSSSARRLPICRWCRATSPTWRSTSTRRRCSSTAPPGPRTRARPRVTREAAMAKLYATERAQSVIDAAVQLHGGDGVRSGSWSSASIGKSGRCASMRARPTSRRSSSRGRPWGSRDARALGASRHVRARQSAAAGAWPEFRLTGFDYPEHVNVAVELTDRMVEKGFGDNTALIGHGRLRTYKELADWTNRLALALVEDLGIVPGNRVLIRSANNPAMVACWLAAVKAGAVSSTPCRRYAPPTRRIDRQGGGKARALRHAADGRARHRRRRPAAS